jgi:hypothetical protein
MGGLFRPLLLVGFIAKFWWLILLVIAVVAAGCRRDTPKQRLPELLFRH